MLRLTDIDKSILNLDKLDYYEMLKERILDACEIYHNAYYNPNLMTSLNEVVTNVIKDFEKEYAISILDEWTLNLRFDANSSTLNINLLSLKQAIHKKYGNK